MKIIRKQNLKYASKQIYWKNLPVLSNVLFIKQIILKIADNVK